MEESKIINEVYLKRKKQGINKEKLSQRIQNELLQKKKKRENANQYISAQSLVKNNRERQKSYSSYKHKIRIANKLIEQQYDKSYEHKPIIIIRICGIWGRIPKEIQLILSKLNLKELYSAIILFYNKETFKMVKLIESYITWGYIKKNIIEEILRKRGSIIVGNNEQNLLENIEIENALGKYGIICLEDIIHELSYETKNAPYVLDYLGYFKLSNKDEGFDKVNIPFNKGGNQGFRGEKINSLLKLMI